MGPPKYGIKYDILLILSKIGPIYSGLDFNSSHLKRFKLKLQIAVSKIGSVR
jgi:hypothetical protein